mmetsp:Transcript_23325/g.51265  ORF Transcript_23325/g.51265 Transcript_23325/m.51265 type:complete len:367 (+) Transcript_23325:198-1298(+)
MAPRTTAPEVDFWQTPELWNIHGPNVSYAEGGLCFRRAEMESIGILMGKAVRSPITAHVTFTDLTGFPDFTFVDLANRKGTPLGGKLADLEADKYIFKAVPMLNRTWMYHNLINSGMILSGKHDQHETIKHVLSMWCCDAPVSSGLASPLPYYVPCAIATCLTANLGLVLMILALIILCLMISTSSNNCQQYKMARLASLPMRLLFFILVLATIDLSDMLPSIGYFLTTVALLADFATGDLASLRNYSMNCQYRIISAHDKRMYVCWREGGFLWEDRFGSRGEVSEVISNLAIWEKQHHLIADIGDLICELRPLTHQDWENLRFRCIQTGEPVPYLALDYLDMRPAEPSRLGTTAKLATDMMLEDL